MSEAGRWPTIVAILCVAFLTSIAGGFTMYVGSFPADVLRRAFQGGIAFYDQLTAYNDPLETEFWQPARSDARGVVRYEDRKSTRLNSSHKCAPRMLTSA